MEAPDFSCWVSDVPDDWHSFSDYEKRIRQLVHEYNEEASCQGEPLLGIPRGGSLYFVVLFSELRTDAVKNQELRRCLEEIRLWSALRMDSGHPDDSDDSFKKGNDAFDEGMAFWNNREYEKAVDCYETAVLYSHPLACFMLGNIFENGCGGMDKDVKRSVNYYQKGTEDELPLCELKMGRLLLYGHVMPDDKEKGFSLIRRAALHGNSAAARELAACYREGAGCKASLSKAKYWESAHETIDGNNDNDGWIRRCEEAGLLEGQLTARQVHFLAMDGYRYWWDERLKSWMPEPSLRKNRPGTMRTA